ncbi:MAG: hypothetical protein KF878_24185 [Planctomycetes bacterium]|nr:hypothetical protein [Planctomycetota bacterium]
MRRAALGRIAAGLSSLVLLGCGLEAVDTQMRTRGDVGVPDERALQVIDVEFVCPHVVPINERAFNPKDVERGEVDGVFGPFVPCNTVVTPGAGTCPRCSQRYRTPGERADEEAPVASVRMSCPRCHETVDPGAVQVRGQDPRQPNRLAMNQCPKCALYFEMAPADVLSVVGVHEEVVCPSCVKPIDPTLNACTTSSCRLGGVVRNVDALEGPCWRCGGLVLCPECQGAGAGTAAVFGNTPSDCWACGTTGRCHECEGTGFSTYHGGLPPNFSLYRNVGGKQQPVESKQRNWQHASPADGRRDDDGRGQDE